MDEILKLVQNYFNLNMLILFLLSSFFLIVVDCKDYRKEGLTKEYKFSLYTGIIYIILGFTLYGLARLIKI